MPQKVFIYALKDPRTNEIRYIGKSINPQHRYHGHLCRSDHNRHKNHWLAQLEKAGLRPVLVILETCTEQTWIEREQYWIAAGRKKGWPLTNLAKGGPSATGHKMSAESIRKHTAAMRGRKLSEETKRKISAAHRGQQFSEEHKRALRENHVGFTGKKRTAEARRKTSEKLKGHPVSAESRAKMSAAKKGKPHKPITEATRAKLRIAARKREAAKRAKRN